MPGHVPSVEANIAPLDTNGVDEQAEGSEEGE
jgi:hypothetical protein